MIIAGLLLPCGWLSLVYCWVVASIWVVIVVLWLPGGWVIAGLLLPCGWLAHAYCWVMHIGNICYGGSATTRIGILQLGGHGQDVREILGGG